MSSGLTNEKGQGASHATQSSVPGTVQDKAPKSVEDKLPDSVHDTDSNKHTGMPSIPKCQRHSSNPIVSNTHLGKVSHATGDSKVPKALQEGLPEKIEKIVPNSIHDTTGAKFSDGSVDAPKK
jgi:hypothetical protein